MVKMTNIEKFKEVFGFTPTDQICVIPKEIECPAEDCGQCEYGGFWYDEYKDNTPRSEAHGRLIDADALLAEIECLKRSPWYESDIMGSYVVRKDAVGMIEDLCIKKAPTVIEAESEDKDLVKESQALVKDLVEDAISRQAVIDACDQSINLFEAVDRIKELPPVNPQEPKTGHWINKSHTSGCGVTFVESECTCCGKKTPFNCDEFLYRYCPNCGAKMVEPQESEEV